MPASEPGFLGRRQISMNRRPFRAAEATYYEAVAAPAVRILVVPLVLEQLRRAPDGIVLDVGCGGGVTTSALTESQRTIIGIDPSIPQVRRFRRRTGLQCVAAAADGVPFGDTSFAAVVASCSVKHWPSRVAGLAECLRVLRPGGLVVIVEIDGGQDRHDLRRFARHARIPRGLRWLYPSLARLTYVPISPGADELMSDCAAVGLTGIRQWRVSGLPFVVVTATR